MISLNPIAKKIQKRLFQKMKLLGREGNSPNKTVSVGGLTHNKLAARSVFIRMISGLEKPVIMMGGELKDNRTMAAGYDEIYGPRGEDTNSFKRPIPGIKSIDVQFKGGTRALREANISWTFEDIDRLMPHFLSVGKTVMIEWGWVYGKDSLINIPTFIDTKNNIKRDAYTDYKNTVIQSYGDFDMMIGIVKNFDFTTRDDGGFDCTTSITSMGVNILDNPTPTKTVTNSAVRWDLSKNLSDDEIAMRLNVPEGADVNTLIKVDFNITLKALIENIDSYLVDKVLKSDGKVEEGYKQDTVTNYLEVSPESAAAVGIGSKGIKTNFKLSTSPNQFIVEHGQVTTGKSKRENGKQVVIFSPIINNAWVRWGWFEDNILSKFLSQVSDSAIDIPIAEFRSVYRVEDTNGEQGNHYESTRIRNSEWLETIDTQKYILPGQFTPLVLPPRLIKKLGFKIKGDSEYIKKLAKMVNQNFKKFTTGDDYITRKEPEFYILKDPQAATNACESQYDANKVVVGTDGLLGVDWQDELVGMSKKTREILGIKVREVEKTRPVPSKHGFMRNMLINTKVIKEAFGVNEGGVETINVREALETMFSLLNQDINFWKFELQNDEYESYRTKIIDTSITEKLPEKGEVISGTTNPTSTTKSIYNKTTDEVTNRGVFFFPVWRHDSIVKRQTINATIPDAMAVSIMYGANADIATTGGDTPTEVPIEEGVATGQLGSDENNKDTELDNLSIALFQEGYENYGTPSARDNTMALTKAGGNDNVLKWLITNKRLISGNYEEKLQAKNEAIQAQRKMDVLNKNNDILDKAVPPPIPTPTSNLTDEQWESLTMKLETLDGNVNSNLLDLYSSKYNKKNKLKEKFIESIKYNTTIVTTTNSTSEIDKTILLPLQLELDIDGIGGIFPSNSFHSSYVPQRYQDDTVFQIFDVNHTVSSEGWTTALRGKMRTSISRVTTTTTELVPTVDIENQFANAKAASDIEAARELKTIKGAQLKQFTSSNSTVDYILKKQAAKKNKQNLKDKQG